MGPTAVVLVKGPPVAAPGTRAAVQALTARLETAAAGDRRGQRLHQPGRRALRSRDGHASVIVVSVRKNASMMAQMMAVDRAALGRPRRRAGRDGAGRRGPGGEPGRDGRPRRTTCSAVR